MINKYNSNDLVWSLGCFGTAIGAGVLFFPITAGIAGAIPFLIMIVIAFPIAYLCHSALIKFITAGNRDGVNDITNVAKIYFGENGGKIVTLLYFCVICPLLWMYGVAFTNTIINFLEYQVQISSPPRAIISLVGVIFLSVIIQYGRDLIVKVVSFIVYPFILCLVIVSLSLIPYWDGGIFQGGSEQNIDFIDILIGVFFGISVMVFSFNHSPIISSMCVAYKEKYPDENNDNLIRKIQKTEKIASILMIFVVIFFAISCVLTLSKDDLALAKEQNVTILTYLANSFSNSNENEFILSSILMWAAPIIAIVSIFKSFFGHYLGALEGLNGLIKGMFKNNKTANYFSIIIIMGSTWAIAWIDPGILDMINIVSAPLIAMLLCIMPVYGIFKIERLKQYKGLSTYWVGFIGLVTLITSVINMI